MEGERRLFSQMKRIVTTILFITILSCLTIAPFAEIAPPADVDYPVSYGGRNTAWYAQAVYDLYYASIFWDIMESENAEPNRTMTRGDFLILLRNLAKVQGKLKNDPEYAAQVKQNPDDQNLNNPRYMDARGNDPKVYSDALDWAAKNGILKGKGYSLAENEEMTRQEMMVFLRRFSDYMDLPLKDRPLPAHFTDLELAGSWAEDSILWTYRKSVINGTASFTGDDGDTVTLNPTMAANRATGCQAVWNYATESGIDLPYWDEWSYLN